MTKTTQGERIAALETEVKNLRDDIYELKEIMKEHTIEEMRAMKSMDKRLAELKSFNTKVTAYATSFATLISLGVIKITNWIK